MAQEKNIPLVMSLSEAAVALNVSTKTLTGLIASHQIELPTVKIGQRIKINRASVESLAGGKAGGHQ